MSEHLGDAKITLAIASFRSIGQFLRIDSETQYIANRFFIHFLKNNYREFIYSKLEHCRYNADTNATAIKVLQCVNYLTCHYFKSSVVASRMHFIYFKNQSITRWQKRHANYLIQYILLYNSLKTNLLMRPTQEAKEINRHLLNERPSPCRIWKKGMQISFKIVMYILLWLDNW